MALDDDNDCPLCIGNFDVTDMNFFPCPCEYQVRNFHFDYFYIFSVYIILAL